MLLDYLTMKEAGKKWGVADRMVTYYCTTGKIKTAIKKGGIWLIPANENKPVDGRSKNGRKLSKNSSKLEEGE